MTEFSRLRGKHFPFFLSPPWSCYCFTLFSVIILYLTDNTICGWNKQLRENDLKQLTTAFSFLLIYWKCYVENAGNAISETLNLKFFWGSKLAWGAFGIRTLLPVGTPLKTHAMPLLKGYQIHFNKAVKKWWKRSGIVIYLYFKGSELYSSQKGMQSSKLGMWKR